MKKSNIKAFTLIEMLIVVLIIGILTAVALPIYRKSVEKSKAATVLDVLGSVATAEQSFFMASGRYTMDYEELEKSFPDKDGNYAEDKEMALKHFKVTLNGTERGKGLVKAERNDGSYTLGKYYEGAAVCCYQKTDTGFCDSVGLDKCDLSSEISQTCTNSSCVVSDDTTVLNCQGDHACASWDYFNSGNLTKLNCQGYYSCYSWGSFSGENLTELTCDGMVSCGDMWAFKGENLTSLSCLEQSACFRMTAFTGKSLTSLTCQGDQSCVAMSSLTGESLTSLSCNGLYSCYAMTSLVGNANTVITVDENYDGNQFNSAYMGTIVCPDSACVSYMSSVYQKATVRLAS